MIGPIYTLQHNRWNVTATGGWLTGFKGGYASVTGKYRLLQDGRGMLMVYAGLGLFGQKYTALNAQQERFAKKMEYDTPFGVQLASKLQVKFSEKWTYGMHIVAPLTLSEQKDNIGRQKNIGHWWLEMFQLSLQYRLQTTGKSKK
ncbi:MAG: hypothetical protein LBO71_06650 [Prevotellaceae bacterium]|nr:hypothetical protein [Prevotellaceae bacterium]